MIVYREVVVYVDNDSDCLKVVNMMLSADARTVKYFTLDGKVDRCNDSLLGCG